MSRIWSAAPVLTLAGALLGYLLFHREPAPPTHPNDRPQAAAPRPRETGTEEPASAFYQGTPARTAPNPQAPPDAYDDEPAVAPSVFPASLDELPSTPWRDAQLARYTPQERAMLDYKLGLMSRMRACAGDVAGAGTVHVFLHYTVDPQTNVAIGAGVDPIESTLDADADRVALSCIQGALAGWPMPMIDAAPTQRDFHWATDIVFPLERDNAYLFFTR